MSKLQQVTVTIGRNVGSRYVTETELAESDGWPTLSDQDWDFFQARVIAALQTTVTPTAGVSSFSGFGEWDGISEESVHIVALGTLDEVNRFALLRGELLKVAFNYRQDAIALAIHGESELVEAEPVI